ncbi:Z1 domain-containing protein [Bacillus sp. KH172YL63]|uniref:Z1 domain-containing protein n=1 Tax=Bacillus sp. KH172YL63 TaxID=2709784 RepID=UPI0013E5195D|nr:Z1 domain-containing protein [Bacillus sp. KH172YL63]BCB04078.1 endonuclease [Bacillus sp. KH172YL63]
MTNYLSFEPLIQMGIKQIKCKSLSEAEIIEESRKIVDRIAAFMEDSIPELLIKNPGLSTHIKNTIQEQINTSQENATTMVCDEWKTIAVEDFKEKWKRFEAFINVLDSEGLPDKVLETLKVDTNNVLKYLPEVWKEQVFKVFGMVVGLVQSGKTNHMMGLTNKLFDLSTDFIVILAGATNTLRNQTQGRGERHVTGYNSSLKRFNQLYKYLENNQVEAVISGTAQDLIDFSKGKPLVLQSGDFSTYWSHVTRYEPGKKYLFIIKKLPNVLQTLTGWFKSQEFFHKPSNRCRKVTLVVMDDECDYYSLNTKDNGETTETNRGIRELLDLFDRSIYIGYTATPFANIFISNNPPDRNLVEFDLFPRHFIQCISPPTNYIGYTHFFGTPKSKAGLLPYIEEIEEYDGDEIEYFGVKGEMLSIPPSLKRALHQFLFNGGVSVLRGYENNHHTMLVHTNVRKKPHKSVVKLLNQYLDELVIDVSNSSGRAAQFWEAIKDIYAQSIKKNQKVNKYQEQHGLQNYDLGFSNHEVMDAVKEYLVSRRAKVVMVNSDSTDVLNFDLYPEGLHVIAVGGTILSRGYTLKGLSVSYFTRQSSQADLMLQCCRWFGYHEMYKDLIRLFTTKTVLHVMCYATGITMQLFEQFHQMCSQGKTPLQYGFAIEETRGILPTARNKMLHSTSTSGNLNIRADYDDAIFPLDNESLKARKERVDILINELGKPEKQDGVYLYREVRVKTFSKWIDQWPNIGNNRSLPGEQLAMRLKALHESGQLSSVDVGIVTMKKNGASESISFANQIDVVPAERKELTFSQEAGIFELSRGRAVTVRHYQYGLTDKEIKIVEERSGTSFQDRATPESKVVSKVRWESASGPRALFLIYVFDMESINKTLRKKHGIQGIDTPAIGYHLLLPKPNNRADQRVNQVYREKYQQIFNALRNDSNVRKDILNENGTESSTG